MALVRPNLFGPGLVLPSGALSKPLIDYLDAILPNAVATVDVSALTARIAALEAAGGGKKLQFPADALYVVLE